MNDLNRAISGSLPANACPPEIATLTLHWLGRDHVPRLIVDQHQMLLWSNAAAKTDLRQQRGLEVRAGQLAASDPIQQATLASFLESCSEGLSTVCLAAEDGDGHLLLRAQLISSDGAGRYLGLSYGRSGAGYKALYPDLDQAFSLTQAEHRVLLQMIEGHTASEIATHTCVSVETVRSHIRSIYAKLNVRSREGVFNRIKPFRL